MPRFILIKPLSRVKGIIPDPDEGTADWDTCPLCGGRWITCGCDPEEADAAYQPEEAA